MSDDHGSGPDPLDEGERAALMRAERPKRGLPIAPHAPEAKRRLPLLAAREKDARYKPIYAVWEITLACDLACRHCGSRAGRDRPDELTTEECLDLVDQMAALGVKEVSLIGGEASTQVVVLDKAGDREVGRTAERILSLLHEQLR